MRTFYIGLLLLHLFSCSKSKKSETPEGNTPQPVPETTITGVFELPAGSTVNPSTLTIQSPVANGTVSNGNYNLATYTGYFMTDFVVNDNKDVIMMGYHMPGEKEPTISITSTALALVMNSQSVLFLSDAGKRLLVAKVLSDVHFPDLKAVVEASVLLNRNLFDETNDLLMQKLSAVHTSVAQRIQQTQGSEAVLLNKVGSTLYFQNNSNASSAVIGIYKNGTRVQKLVVEGLQYVPTSINETFNGYQGISADPVQYPFSFSGDGVYELKVRTGRPGSDDGSVEHKEAFYSNLALLSYNVMTLLTPLLNGSTCNKATILSNLISFLMTVPDILASPNAYAASHDALSMVFQNLDFIISDCVKKQPNSSYFSSVAKAFNFIDKAFAVLGTTANVTFFSKHWISTTPVWDTCMTVQGSMVTGCYPTVNTLPVDSITQTSAICGLGITSQGASSVTRKGLCLSTKPKPTTANTTISPDQSDEVIRINGLSSGTTYYIRAFATNKNGTGYGIERVFTTL